MSTPTNAPNFAELLKSAVNQPGLIMQAYSAFHTYSFSNQLHLVGQLAARGLPIGPVASFSRWNALNRKVKKGEKAMSVLCPVTIRKDKGNPESECFTMFKPRNCAFHVSQTEGDELPPAAPLNWSKELALTALEITETPYASINGNSQGYAVERTIAINPVAQLPLKTTFHEIAHVVLGHTAEHMMTDNETTPRDIREVEAESVALLCLESLGLEGAEFCRGYIQGWLQADSIPEKSARKIMSAADKILKAGFKAQPQAETETA